MVLRRAAEWTDDRFWELPHFRGEDRAQQGVPHQLRPHLGERSRLLFASVVLSRRNSYSFTFILNAASQEVVSHGSCTADSNGATAESALRIGRQDQLRCQGRNGHGQIHHWATLVFMGAVVCSTCVASSSRGRHRWSTIAPMNTDAAQWWEPACVAISRP